MALTTEELLRRAATTAQGRIDHDHQRASDESRRMLELIRQHLFDPRLNVDWMLASLELSHNASSRFRAEIGIAPKRYIDLRRLETARRLLRDTDLEVQDIGTLIGYRRFAAFSHAFKQRTGRRPKAYRDALPPIGPPVADEAPQAAEPQEGILLDDETRQAALRLAQHYGCSTSQAIRRAVLHLSDAVF